MKGGKQTSLTLFTFDSEFHVDSTWLADSAHSYSCRQAMCISSNRPFLSGGLIISSLSFSLFTIAVMFAFLFIIVSLLFLIFITS
jgi:hypothetical protein